MPNVKIDVNVMFRYAVKIVCGVSRGKVVAPGYYWTAINVHNPTNTHVSFWKRIIQALPGEEAGKVSDRIPAELRRYQALEIDCQDILDHYTQYTGDEIKFLKGFVIIVSQEVMLDVVAVYTAAAAEDEPVQTIHVERVLPRKL